MEEAIEQLSAAPTNGTSRRESNELPEDRESGGRQAAPFCSLFYFADRLDWLLMFFGSIGSCVHGAALPLFFVLFGKLINSLGSLSTDPEKLSAQ